MRSRAHIVLAVFTLLACQTIGQPKESIETTIAGTVAVQQGVSATLTADATQPLLETINLTTPVETHTPSHYEVALAVEEQFLKTGERNQWLVSLSEPQSVLLSLEARVDWSTPAGLAYIMGLSVNDFPITDKLLVNKPVTFTFADGRVFNYFDYIADYTAESIPYWGVFYSPDYQVNNIPQIETSGSNNIYLVKEGSAYSYIFNITPLLTGTETEIALVNNGGKYEEILGQPIILSYRQLTVSISNK